MEIYLCVWSPVWFPREIFILFWSLPPYSIPKQNLVKLVVYDIIGREIAALVNEVKQPGNYSVGFDASNLASGVYFYRMAAGDFTDVKKMVLIK